MSLPNDRTGLQLRSLLTADGDLRISLERMEIARPGSDQVVVAVEATPINPSDLGLLLGPADLSTAVASGSRDAPVLTARMPEAGVRALAGRIGQSLPVGNEGAGTVVEAGDAPEAQALLGKRVAMLGGAMYAQYRVMRAADCLLLPDGATAADGASCFVNPLTVLGMVETMRLENHKALVHTAAASNLGQMLVKLCQEEGIGLVNVVRSAEQVALLRGLGAEHVLDSTSASFMGELTDALATTGATLAFDAIGGGRLASQLLSGMEAAATRQGGEFSRYGSNVHKQVYIYGALDLRPTELSRSFGFAWGVCGWLLTPMLGRLGPDGVQRMRQRVIAGLKTTFASHYTREISLFEALDPSVMAVYNRRATGEKYLIDPSRPAA